MKKCSLLFYLLILISSIAFSQSPDLRFEHFDIKDGVSNMRINDIFQDSLGFLWIGTWDGLSFYDGKSFKNYHRVPFDTTSLSDNDIQSIAEDREGNIWLATRNGVNRFNRQQGHFSRFMRGRAPNQVPHHLTKTSFVDPQGKIWIGFPSNNNLLEYDPKCQGFNKNHLPKGEHTNCIDYWNDYLFLGNKKGITIFDKSLNTSVESDSLFPNLKKLEGVRVFDILVSKKEEIWIATIAGLYRYAPKTDELININETDGLNHYAVLSIAEDHYGGIWAGTPRGLHYINQEAKVLGSYKSNPDNPASLKDDYITSLLIDQAGNLWVGTVRGGIHKASLNFTKRFNAFPSDFFGERHLNLSVSAIAEGKNNRLWIGTNHGLFLLDKKSKDIISHYKNGSDSPISISGNLIMAVYEDEKEKVYISMEGKGLDILDIKTQKITRYPKDATKSNHPRSLQIRSIKESFIKNQRIIWLTGNSGFQGHDPDNNMEIIHNYPRSAGLPYALYSWDLLPFDSCTIVSTHNNGMLWLDLCGTAPGFRFWNSILIDPPGFSIISVLRAGADEIWAGSYGAGLFKVNFYTGELKNYTLDEGLKNNYIYGILKDTKENLWMSTNRGISKFNPKTEIFTNFGIDEGLQGEEFSSGSFYKTKDGEMLFGGTNGFTSFYPDSIEEQSSSFNPEILITSVKISGEEIQSDSAIYLKKRIEFPSYKAQHLEIQFTSLDLSQPEKNLFQYQLEGYDEQWSNPSPLNIAQYTQLEPGTYTFKVNGTNRDGIFSSHVSELTIILVPLWHQTKWFRVGTPLLLLLIISLLIYLRIRRLRQNERLRLNSQITRVKQEALAAQMDHHFTFNSLNSIQRYIMDNNREAAIRFISRFGKLIRKVLDQADKNYQTIEEELETLELYLKLEQHRTKETFQYQFIIDDEIDIYNTEIPTNLIQPYLENAIWHGLMPLEDRNGLLTIKINIEGKKLLCQIEDNGIGRKKAGAINQKSRLKHNSKGMRITAERIEALNFLDKMEIDSTIIDLESDSGEAMGTRVAIQMLLP